MNNKKNRAIIFIHKDKFDYYDEAQSKIFQFVFQSAIFQDLELVDGDQLNVLIKNFAVANKLSPASILFLISDNIIFEKIFTGIPANNHDAEIRSYLETIPFEHVSYKVINMQQNFKVLAMNKELYSALAHSFNLLGFETTGAIPQSTLGNAFKNTQNLTPDLIKYVLLNLNSLQTQFFLEEENRQTDQMLNGEEKTDHTPDSDKTASNPALAKYRLPALISVFVILIGVLGYVVYSQYTPRSNANPVPSAVSVPTIVPTVPPLQEEPPSSPSAEPT